VILNNNDKLRLSLQHLISLSTTVSRRGARGPPYFGFKKKKKITEGRKASRQNKTGPPRSSRSGSATGILDKHTKYGSQKHLEMITK